MKKTTGIICVLIVLIIGLNFISCSKESSTEPTGSHPSPPVTGHGPYLPVTPYNYAGTINNLPPFIADYITTNPTVDNTPPDNTITNEGATLGRVLFYDSSLSVNNKISCGSCHHQDHGFADDVPYSTGFLGGLTKRNAMPVVNTRFFQAKKMFWDLRAADLETQTLIPIQDHIEMGMPTLAALEDKVKLQSYYPPLFKNAFGTTEITSDKIARAISQFVRSIVSFGSKYDQGLANNFQNFTAAELNGKIVFANSFCGECHSDLHHTGYMTTPTFLVVENYGLNLGFGANNGLDAIFTDAGIGGITGDPKDMGDFKIPSLRNVALTAPYMHDGRFATLEEVVEHYSTGIKQNPNIGIQVGATGNGFNFTDQQKADLVAFLKTLTDTNLATDTKYSNPFK